MARSLAADDLRSEVGRACRETAPVAARLARQIYGSPELSSEEHQASFWCKATLVEHGFDVAAVRGAETAFVASLKGSGVGPTIGFLAEYDALPGLGHACGHHLIAGSAVGAGLALARCRDSFRGTVQVFGCPAEETGRGKVVMLNAGAFANTDVAFTFHAHDVTSVMTTSNGVKEFDFDFHGRPAHAATDPWSGASALDGVLLTFQNINALRQFIRDGARIHGTVTKGGDAPNIVVEHAACKFMVRSANPTELDRIAARVVDCANAAALATDTGLTVEEGMRLDPVRLNQPLAEVVRSNLGTYDDEVVEWPALASTDFGNVSTGIPAVLFSVSTWPAGTVFHTHEAAALAGEEKAFAAMSQAAEVMALSACDLFSRPHLVEQAQCAHACDGGNGGDSCQQETPEERGAVE